MRLGKYFFLVVATFSTFVFSGEMGHIQEGSQYGEKEAKALNTHRHGPDGSLFLDSYFISELQDLKDLKLVDVGCGCACWSILSAKNGAKVWGIDIQEKIIHLAKKKVIKEGLEKSIFLDIGDAAKLPYSNQFFDRAISINVGCNLPSTTFLIKDGFARELGLGPHIREIARVLKKNGKAVVTAPASFGTIFTNGDSNTRAHVDDVAKRIAETDNIELLNELDAIYRVTFALRDGKWTLIEKERELRAGEKIWRRIPGLIVPNYYHSENEYLQAFQDAGLVVEQIHRPSFNNEEDWEKEPGDFGKEYIGHHPFVIFILKKET